MQSPAGLLTGKLVEVIEQALHSLADCIALPVQLVELSFEVPDALGALIDLVLQMGGVALQFADPALGGGTRFALRPKQLNCPVNSLFQRLKVVGRGPRHLVIHHSKRRHCKSSLPNREFS
jgi:hypothetical protein